MEIEDPQLARILIITMGVFVLLQGLLGAVALLLFSHQIKRLDSGFQSLSQKMKDALVLTGQLLTGFQGWFPEMLPGVNKGLGRLFDDLTRVVHRGDQAADYTLVLLRSQMAIVSRHLDTVLTRFSQETFKAHRAIVEESHHLSALLRVGSSYLSRILVRGQPKAPSTHLSDSDIFI